MFVRQYSAACHHRIFKKNMSAVEQGQARSEIFEKTIANTITPLLQKHRIGIRILFGTLALFYCIQGFIVFRYGDASTTFYRTEKAPNHYYHNTGFLCFCIGILSLLPFIKGLFGVVFSYSIP